MMKRLVVCVAASLMVHGLAPAATQFLGGQALFHSWPSQNLEPGQLSIQWHSRMWAASVNEGNISNVSQALALNFGFSKHLELEIVPMLYQDLNFSSSAGVTYNAPDDIYFRMRFGNYKMRVADLPLAWGAQLAFRANSSRVSNVYLEPYNGGANEVGLGGVVSWYANQLYPLEGQNAHFNINYLNHNDGGNASMDLFTNTTHDLEFALSYRRPSLRTELFAELYGNMFLKKPQEGAFTRANVVWLQPGLTYRFFRGMSLTAGVDIRLMESGPEVWYVDEAPRPSDVHRNQARLSDEYPEYYPAWRVTAKLSFQPSTAFRHVDTFADVKPESERDWEMRQKIGVSEREMIDWLGAEDQSAEFLDLELEKIRAERRKAEKELERLKEKLKDQ